MNNNYFDRIQALPGMSTKADVRPELRMWDDSSSGLACYYAPFEHLNPSADLILVGITPGRSQMNRALHAARDALVAGLSVDQGIASVKREASFSGDMRRPLIDLLDRLGYNRKLGIASCESLWGADFGRVQFSSLLRYPVFFKGADYKGERKAMANRQLREMLMKYFVEDLKRLPPGALLIPLGETVLETLVALHELGLVRQQIPRHGAEFVAPPHPSGGNKESIELVMSGTYCPDPSSYADAKYADYLARKDWLKKGRSGPMEGTKYKKTRHSRWHSMRLVRQAHGLTV